MGLVRDIMRMDLDPPPVDQPKNSGMSRKRYGVPTNMTPSEKVDSFGSKMNRLPHGDMVLR